jgi:hypothetical protein
VSLQRACGRSCLQVFEKETVETNRIRIEGTRSSLGRNPLHPPLFFQETAGV